MKFFLAVSFAIVCSLPALAQFEYMSPVPGSKYHQPEETIILRNGAVLDEASALQPKLITVTGSMSGIHECAIKLAEGNRTLLVQPNHPFAEGETVDVTVGDGLHSVDGKRINGTSFSFFIRPAFSEADRDSIAKVMRQVYQEDHGTGGAGDVRDEGFGGNGGFPVYDILTNTTPEPGEIFWHNFSLFNVVDAHYCIIENNGDSVYGKLDNETFNNWDLNHNGYLTAYNRTDSVYEVFDSNYVRIASIQCGNGYKTDVHEFQIYGKQPYLFAYDPEIVDMTVYNPGYSSHATVVGLIVQQLDSVGNVIFQWRSWDHFLITDVNHVNLYSSLIDAVHGNSLEVDADGNIIISARHLSEISKINRTTGDFIWRLGGANNQFTFLNDSSGISWQHDVRRLPNGDLTVFDNGNYHTPPKTSAKEYALDEVNKTADLVWSYSRTLSGGMQVLSTAMGSVQKLSGGHYFICWGLTYTPNSPQITEVDSLGNVVWELQIQDVANTIYRARKYAWHPCARPSASSLKVKDVTATSAKIKWSQATNAIKYDVRYQVHGSGSWTTKSNITKVSKKIKNLTPSTQYDYQVRSQCDQYSPSNWSFRKSFKTLPPKEELLDVPSSWTFECYPNPAQSSFEISFQLPFSAAVTFSLYDVSGRVVYSSSGTFEEGAHALAIDVSHLPRGMYFTELRSGANKQVGKVVLE